MTLVRTASGVVSLADSSRVIQVWTWLRSARSALTTPSLALLDLAIGDRSSRGGQGRSINLQYLREVGLRCSGVAHPSTPPPPHYLWKTIRPPTRVISVRPIISSPPNGVFLLLEQKCPASTFQRASGSKSTTSAGAPT